MNQTIDNHVTEAVNIGTTGIWEVELRRAPAGLWENDTIIWQNLEWRVWKIDGNKLTLVRVEV